MYEKQFNDNYKQTHFFIRKSQKKGQSFSKNIPQALGEVMAT
jgi:hypothetical protein